MIEFLLKFFFLDSKGWCFGLLVFTSFASMSGSMLLSEVMRPESLLGLDVSTPGMFPKVKFIRILCLCDVIDPFSSSPTLRWNVLPSSVTLYWEFSEGINFCSFFGIILSMSRSSAHFESKAIGWDSWNEVKLFYFICCTTLPFIVSRPVWTVEGAMECKFLTEFILSITSLFVKFALLLTRRLFLTSYYR